MSRSSRRWPPSSSTRGNRNLIRSIPGWCRSGRRALPAGDYSVAGIEGAHAAAERLSAAARPAPPAHPRPAQRASTAAQLARLSFPQSPRPATPGQPVWLQADRHQCEGRRHRGRRGPTRDDASTHSSAHQMGSSARHRHATLGGSILRLLASAGCCMPVRRGASATLTLA